MTPLVEARGLGKSYADGPAVVRVLADLDLAVMPGERIAVVGASGVGKSTLLHLLGALDRPTAGQLVFDGVDLAARSENELATFRNREVGFVFQFHHLLGDFTALENVMLPALIAREPARLARARARDLLARVGLEERLHHRPGALSGGEQQRVAVARAVMHRPRLVLADEPTGNLDPVTGETVQQLLLDLNREHGSALVVATHNPGLAGALGRALRLADGRLTEEAPAAAPAARRGGRGGGAL
ncbi:MAG TPA: ABC transporter ATP-binding protein [Candidatus Binatia bacterium]|nr:ABC transporter ATP-binding protein [Candidatus Binatia bacterium]